MSRDYRGALTIEAAIVLPLVMLALASVIFIGRVYYIQDQIHSAMTKVAHELSVDAYALDQVGLIDVQQDLYNQGVQGMSSIQEAALSVAEQKEALFVNMNRVTDYSGEVMDWSGGIELGMSGGSWSETASEAVELVKEAPKLAASVIGNMETMMSALESLAKEANSHLGSIAEAEVMDLTNGLIATKMTDASFRRYVGEAQLEAWGVEGIDFSLSTYMMPDDTIELVAFYEIHVPYGNQWWGDTIPIFQKVKARAWTGSYDTSEYKHRQMPSEDTEAEAYFYIATGSEGNHSYHYYHCLVKPLTESVYQDEVVDRGRDVCKYCEAHCLVENEWMPVWYTSRTAKIHLTASCPRIKAIDVVRVTEAEAISMGMDPCDKYGCVVKTREAEE